MQENLEIENNLEGEIEESKNEEFKISFKRNNSGRLASILSY